jgi:hypothetical protein
LEKYGVVLDEEKTKTASTDKKCPKCGGELLYGKMVSKEAPFCADCGTEPFEKREEKK